MERPQQSLTPRVYRIFVVEDNLDLVHSTCLLLREQGHICEYAINGYVALTEARRFKPDYILLDIGLPGIDGFEVCRQVRADPELAGVKIIVVTAYTDSDTQSRAKAAGCDLVLAKPLNPTELIQLFSTGNGERQSRIVSAK